MRKNILFKKIFKLLNQYNIMQITDFFKNKKVKAVLKNSKELDLYTRFKKAVLVFEMDEKDMYIEDVFIEEILKLELEDYTYVYNFTKDFHRIDYLISSNLINDENEDIKLNENVEVIYASTAQYFVDRKKKKRKCATTMQESIDEFLDLLHSYVVEKNVMYIIAKKYPDLKRIKLYVYRPTLCLIEK
ncbi:MAG: hypothetical protein RSB87_02095 [Clostridia bacterium]